MNYVLKYQSGAFVGEDSYSGGYPYETKNLSSARMFDDHSTAMTYLLRLFRQFPDAGFDRIIYQITVSPGKRA